MNLDPNRVSESRPILANRLIATGILAAESPWAPLPGGADNDLVAARSADGTEVIVKTRRPERSNRHALAAWAAARMTGIGIPVPIPLWHDDQTWIETRIPGLPLADSDDDQAAADAGRLLRRVHSLPVDGFGRLDAEGKGRYPDWGTWLLALPTADTLPGPVAGLAHQARQAVGANLRSLDVHKASLLHGDWTARHVLADDGRVTGFVDLESVRGGDPLADLAGWSLQESGPLTTALFAGYFEPGEPDADQALVLALYRLRIAASLLAFHHACGRSDLVALRRTQLRADLTALEAGRPTAIPLVTPM
ncbi:phosphotransferase family protein [Embleya sp. NPDC059237]|uniref:phosphotransferase family protein n=1 Tax=Embleya sp. NPDC059237 TaxID=3346784 RepID=UPI0036C02170